MEKQGEGNCRRVRDYRITEKASGKTDDRNYVGRNRRFPISRKSRKKRRSSGSPEELYHAQPDQKSARQRVGGASYQSQRRMAAQAVATGKEQH